MRTQQLTPDAFDHLIALSELKQSVFFLLTMNDRFNFSLVNKVSRNFFVSQIEPAILNDLMQVADYRLSAEFWNNWNIPDQITRLNIAIKLLTFIKKDYPDYWKRQNFIRWLACDAIQGIDSVQFWQLCLYKVLLNIGIEVIETERHIRLVTSANLAAVKAFILSQYRCRETWNTVHVGREFLGLRFIVNQIDDLDYDKEVAAINGLINSFREAGLNDLADQLKKRMLLSFLKDDSEEAVTVDQRAVAEHRLLVDKFTVHYDEKTQQEIRDRLNELKEFYQYDPRSARMAYAALSKLSSEEAFRLVEVALKGVEDDIDTMLNTFLSLKNLQAIVPHFQQKQYGNFIADLFLNNPDKFFVDVSRGIINLNDEEIYQTLDEFFNLYSYLKKTCKELHTLAPILARLLQLDDYSEIQNFMAMLHKIDQQNSDNNQALFRFLFFIGRKEESEIDRWLRNAPKLYELNPSFLGFIDSDRNVFSDQQAPFYKLIYAAEYSSQRKRLHRIAQLGYEPMRILCREDTIDWLNCLLSLPAAAFEQVFSDITKDLTRLEAKLDFYKENYACFGTVSFRQRRYLQRVFLADYFTLEDLEKAARATFFEDSKSDIPDNLLSLIYVIYPLIPPSYDIKKIVFYIVHLHDDKDFLDGMRRLVTMPPIALEILLRVIINRAESTWLPVPPRGALKRSRTERDGGYENTDLSPKHKPYQARNLTFFAADAPQTKDETQKTLTDEEFADQVLNEWFGVDGAKKSSC